MMLHFLQLVWFSRESILQKLLLLKNSNLYTNLKHKSKLKYHCISANFQLICFFPNDDGRTVGFKQIETRYTTC